MENYGDAIGHLFMASELGAHATMKKFLKKQLIKAPPPKAYLPIEKIK